MPRTLRKMSDTYALARSQDRRDHDKLVMVQEGFQSALWHFRPRMWHLRSYPAQTHHSPRVWPEDN